MRPDFQSGSGSWALRGGKVEVETNEVPKLFTNPLKDLIHKEFQKLGFKFITVDLIGYQKGSNNYGNCVALFDILCRLITFKNRKTDVD